MEENTKEVLQQAQELGEQMAEAYDNGYLNSLAKTNTKVVQAFKTRYEAIDYQLKYGLITEEEYYDKLAKIRDMYFSRNSQEWHKYTAEIYDYKVGVMESYKQAVEDNLNDILKISQQKYSQLKKEQEDFSSDLQDFGGGIGLKSNKVQIGNYYPNGEALVFTEHSLADFDEEIKKLEHFSQSLEQLKEKTQELSPDVISSFFSELGNISIEDAQVMMDLLLKSSETDFNKYFESYQKRNELSDSISKSFYEAEAQNMANELRQELEATFSEIPAEFLSYGEITGENFVDGFMSKVDGLLSDLETFLSHIQVDITRDNDSEGNQSVFSPVYYFYGDRASTSRTRMTAKNDALFTYMRGLE